jgi:hypothetical protein
MQMFMKDDDWERFHLSRHGFINSGSVIGRRKRSSEVGLGIKVNQQHLIALAGKNTAKAAGSRGFANSPLMVGNGDNS